jgi:ribosomal protein S18 acetylase RimI-like enzyme
MLKFSIRAASQDDIDRICALDPIAHQGAAHRKFIERSVDHATCLVATAEPDIAIAAYAVLDYSFFEQGFLSMLFVHSGYRRRGIGTMLIASLEATCETEKLFTSTNLSNLPMQSLLAKLGYGLAGTIHHLDEDDPELIYVKYLRTGVA